MPYLETGCALSGFRMQPGMSRCSASYKVSLIHVSNTNTDLSYKQRLETLVEEEELPIIIVDYLMCKS